MKVRLIVYLLVIIGVMVGLHAVLNSAIAAKKKGGETTQMRQTRTDTTVAGRVQSLDDLFAEVAKRVPAFGGMFIGQDKTLQVYLLDPSQRAAAEAAIIAVFGRERLPQGRIQSLQGQYGFLQLKDWHDRYRMTTLAIPGVLQTSIEFEFSSCGKVL